MTHPARLSEEELLKLCEFGRGRASGPGGQHRNKVETEVTLTHRATGISGKAGERRSQGENKKVALRRLRLALAVEVREGGGEASEVWRSRVKGGRIACNPEHWDYPMLVAEAMDALEASGWEPREAGAALGVSGTQLVKLLKDWGPAMERLNAEREKLGKRRLK